MTSSELKTRVVLAFGRKNESENTSIVHVAGDPVGLVFTGIDETFTAFEAENAKLREQLRVAANWMAWTASFCKMEPAARANLDNAIERARVALGV